MSEKTDNNLISKNKERVIKNKDIIENLKPSDRKFENETHDLKKVNEKNKYLEDNNKLKITQNNPKECYSTLYSYKRV